MINSRFSNGDSEVTVKNPGKRGVENGLAGPDQSLNGRKGGHHDDDRGDEGGTDTENENEDNENNENDEEEEEEDDNEGPYVPYRCPGTFVKNIVNNFRLNSGCL